MIDPIDTHCSTISHIMKYAYVTKPVSFAKASCCERIGHFMQLY